MRDKLDRYYTDPRVARACVDVMMEAKIPHSITRVPGWYRGALFIEPSSGGGAFLDALGLRYPLVYAYDIDPEAVTVKDGRAVCMDWLDMQELPGTKRDYRIVFGNPPYKHAQEHIEHAFKLGADEVWFLLRTGFTGSLRRYDMHKACGLMHKSELVPRPSFTGDGKTDGSEYAFFGYCRGFEGFKTFDIVRWRE